MTKKSQRIGWTGANRMSGIPLRACRVSVSVLAVFLILFFPGRAAAGEMPDETVPQGGELTIGMLNFPIDLNPAIRSGVYTGLPGAQLFAAPLRYDENWNPRPYLAEKWEVAENGRSVTLHLVKNATFHDGHPVTSEDVAFSVLTVQTYHPFNAMFAPVERVDTPDSHTAVIRLKKPHPSILLAMSSVLLPILPKHVYGDVKNVKSHPANMAPIGSGPFRFVESVPGDHILLERYDKFFIKGRPRLDKIRFKIFRMVDLLSLSGGEIDVLPFYLHPLGRDLFENDDSIDVTYKGYGGVGPLYLLAFNLRKKPFDDLRVRQAIAYAIDRDFIIKTMLKGNAQKATGPIVSDSPFYSADVNQYHPDVKKANDLLDEAGYPRDETGKRFQVTFDFIPGNTEMYHAIIEYLRNDILRKLGVEFVLGRSENFRQWADTVSNGDFTITQDTPYNWGDPVIGVHRTYDCDNIRKGVIWSNTQAYCNPLVNELMEAAGSEMDFEKRKALYARFQKIVVDDLPVYYLMKIPFMTCYNVRLSGLNDSIWGMLSPLDRVYWKKKP